MTADNVNREHMQAFIAALRSGEYKQVRGTLVARVNGVTLDPSQPYQLGYCCLGVACMVAKDIDPDLNLTIVYEQREDGREQAVGFREGARSHLYNTALPQAVMDFYGLIAANPLLIYGAGEVAATTANDYLQWDFVEIAAAFERTYITDTYITHTTQALR